MKHLCCNVTEQRLNKEHLLCSFCFQCCSHKCGWMGNSSTRGKNTHCLTGANVQKRFTQSQKGKVSAGVTGLCYRLISVQHWANAAFTTWENPHKQCSAQHFTDPERWARCAAEVDQHLTWSTPGVHPLLKSSCDQTQDTNRELQEQNANLRQLMENNTRLRGQREKLIKFT